MSLSSTPAAPLSDPSRSTARVTDAQRIQSRVRPLAEGDTAATRPQESAASECDNGEHGHVLVPPVRRPLHAMGQQQAIRCACRTVSSSSAAQPPQKAATAADDVPPARQNATAAFSTSSALLYRSNAVVPPPPPTSRPRSSSPPVGSSMRHNVPPTTRPLRQGGERPSS